MYKPFFQYIYIYIFKSLHYDSDSHEPGSRYTATYVCTLIN